MAQQRAFLKSLRGKVTTQMLLVSLVPILIVGAVVYTSMTSAENKTSNSVDDSRTTLENNTVGKTKGRIAWLLSLELETWAAERISEVNSWAGNTDIRQAATSSSDDGQAAWAMLAEKVSGSPFFDDAYITDLSGERIVQVKGYQPKKEFDNPVWKTAMSKGLYVSEVSLDTASIQPFFNLDIAFRIDDFTTKSPLGVVVGQIALNPITLRQEYGSKLPDDRLVIWSHTGKLIIDSGNMERFIEQNPSWTEAEQRVLDKMTTDVAVILPSYVITDEAVAGYARAANESVSVQFTGFEGLGWMVMVEEPSKTALAALDSLETLKDDLSKNTSNMLITLVVILIVVLIGAPGVAFYLSRGITKPIAQLNDAAEKVSMGDMGVTIDVKSDDEIGDLAKSFGRMVVAVRFLASDQDEEQK